MKIYIEYSFRKSAWGGGNQFLKSLKKEFEKYGIYSNSPDGSNIILFNAHQNHKQVVKLKAKFPTKVFAHRMDGIYKLYNHKRDTRQDVGFNLNKRIANCTIFQTNWAKKEHENFGFKLDKPYDIICNAPNGKMFNTNYVKTKSNKVRLVCTSWSTNKNKGFEYYKFLDENLNFDKYSFTYIGNDPRIKFKNIQKIGPFDTLELSKHLKENDIFITASKHECCSNSLLEAMACGLPSIGLDSGGTPEIIKNGGELFSSKNDLIKCIDKVSCRLPLYSSNISIPSIRDISNHYIYFFNKQL
jgi:glycosyltransferase involved in cell wall biosynthesis